MIRSMRPIRVLVAKPGLDGHDRGAKSRRRARDAGMEVIYTGLHQTPEMIATAAVQEDVDVVGLSILSGAHMTLFPRVLTLLKDEGREDILVTGGGIIPKEDMDALHALGIGKLFGPGTSTADLVQYIKTGSKSALARKPESPVTSRLRELSDEPARSRPALETRRRTGQVRQAAQAGETLRARARHAAARLAIPFHRDRPARRLRSYDGQAPGAGVITGVGDGRRVDVSWSSRTTRRSKRGRGGPRRSRRSSARRKSRCAAGFRSSTWSIRRVNLPYQGGVFPGQYGAARIFYYNSLMRRYLRVPQIAAVMGQCVAGGAYLPALSDVILMVKGTSFMGLAGPTW